MDHMFDFRMSDEEVKKIVEKMEEMANAPKEELGKRQPGERGMYERKTN